MVYGVETACRIVGGSLVSERGHRFCVSGRLERMASGFHRIRSFFRKAERIVLSLKACCQIERRAESNSILLKSKQPVRVALAIASA